jgi:hypothetical protein
MNPVTLSCRHKNMLKGILSLSILFSATVTNAQTALKSNDSRIHYMGRVASTDEKTTIQWSGTSAKLNFKGTGIKVVLNDETGNNWFNVIVDGKVTKIFRPEKDTKEYVLASGLSNIDHSVELFKRTEAENGKTWLQQFVLDKGASILEAPVTKKRKIEFYGNSITCGLAMADTVKGQFGDENNYLAYGALTARYFDAEYYCIARSGIGITVSWFPMIMPEMYDRLDETDPNSKWDFSKYTPDVVVTDLGQNDSWIVKQTTNAEYKKRFGAAGATEERIVKAYVDFLTSLKNKYPQAKIVCALGGMDAAGEGSPWPGFVEKAVKQLNSPDIFAYIFPYNPNRKAFNHPSVAEHKVMADQLIAFMEKNIKW